MDSLKDFFRLDVVMRHCLGGIAFFLTIYILENGLPDTEALNKLLTGSIGATNLIAIILVVFLTGTLIHNLTRSTLGPLAEKLKEKYLNDTGCLNWTIPTDAINLTVERFLRLKMEKRYSEMTAWGGATISLYSVGFGIIVGLIYSWFLGTGFDACYCYDYILYYPAIFLVAILFIGAGFITDCRKTRVEKALYLRDIWLPRQ